MRFHLEQNPEGYTFAVSYLENSPVQSDLRPCLSEISFFVLTLNRLLLFPSLYVNCYGDIPTINDFWSILAFI